MIAAAARTAGVAAVAATVLLFVFAPGRNAHRVLDPNDPIAADGSMIAGRATTIYDTEPAYRAPVDPHPTSDDPADFEPMIKRDRGWAESDRALFKRLLGQRLDWSLCAGTDHVLLMAAVRSYYGTRGREKHIFSLRGPRATAAIAQEWSTPLDRQIAITCATRSPTASCTSAIFPKNPIRNSPGRSPMPRNSAAVAAAPTADKLQSRNGDRARDRAAIGRRLQSGGDRVRLARRRGAACGAGR